MKQEIDKIDTAQFVVREHEVANETVFLVFPLGFPTWNHENLVFRSSVWNSNGELISAGFPKFFNWGERDDLIPAPNHLENCEIMEKLDGSLLIVSRYKGEWLIRTRGTMDASLMDNGDEIAYFKEKYPLVFSEKEDTWDYSLLFEWCTPNNQIVLRYNSKPFIKLIGRVDHINYCLASQSDLDALADNLDVARPRRYTFDDVDHMLEKVYEFENLEGVCIYSRNGQVIHKVKSAWYLALHHMKSELSSIVKLVDFWFSKGRISHQEMYDLIFETFDFELAEFVDKDLRRIVDAYNKVEKDIENVNEFVNSIWDLPTRKEQAFKVLEKYKKSPYAGVAFTLLDGKNVSENDMKKFLKKELENS